MKLQALPKIRLYQKSYGLKKYRIYGREVKFAGQKKDDGTDGANVAIAARLAFGCLKESVERFEKSVCDL